MERDVDTHERLWILQFRRVDRGRERMQELGPVGRDREDRDNSFAGDELKEALRMWSLMGTYQVSSYSQSMAEHFLQKFRSEEAIDSFGVPRFMTAL